MSEDMWNDRWNKSLGVLQALASGVISRESACRLVAPFWGLDPDEEWAKVKAEAAEGVKLDG